MLLSNFIRNILNTLTCTRDVSTCGKALTENSQLRRQSLLVSNEPIPHIQRQRHPYLHRNRRGDFGSDIAG